jgi:hypothetical protein
MFMSFDLQKKNYYFYVDDAPCAAFCTSSFRVHDQIYTFSIPHRRESLERLSRK